jgi:mannose-6-phosphate isomerase-like protein (cupin superfamily)
MSTDTSGEPPRAAHIPLAEAMRQIPAENGAPFAELFRRGSFSVEIFSPKDVDTQKPHAQDEAYFIVSGMGEFFNGETRHPVAPGDFIFVQAGVVHRFENFSDDLVVWVVFV